MNLVKQEDWKTNPIPKQRVKLTFNRIFSTEQTELIKVGLPAKGMEDKWFIYFENNELFFHRSWTGNCIFQVQFEHKENSLIATYIEANRDLDQYSETDNKNDLYLVNRLIDKMLLHTMNK